MTLEMHTLLELLVKVVSSNDTCNAHTFELLELLVNGFFQMTLWNAHTWISRITKKKDLFLSQYGTKLVLISLHNLGNSYLHDLENNSTNYLSKGCTHNFFKLKYLLAWSNIITLLIILSFFKFSWKRATLREEGLYCCFVAPKEAFDMLSYHNGSRPPQSIRYVGHSTQPESKCCQCTNCHDGKVPFKVVGNNMVVSPHLIQHCCWRRGASLTLAIMEVV